MGIAKKLGDFVSTVIDIVLPPLFLALFVFSFIYLPFLYLFSKPKQKFLKNNFGDLPFDIKKWSINFDSIFLKYITIALLLSNCIFSYSNFYLYLNGLQEKEVVLKTVHVDATYDERGTQLYPEHYLLSVSRSNEKIFSYEDIPLGDTVTILRAKGNDTERLYLSGRYHAAFSGYPYAATALYSVLLNGLIGFVVLMATLVVQVVAFIRKRSEKTRTFPLYSKAFLTIINFIVVAGLSIAISKTIYNEVPYSFLGGIIIFIILICTKYFAFFESILQFLLKHTFDELDSVILEILGFLIKASASITLLLGVYKSIANRNESLINVITDAFGHIFG